MKKTSFKTKVNSILQIFIALILCLITFLSINRNNSYTPNNETSGQNTNSEITSNLLKIHYIDVDQGDAIFIELPNSQTMLIDAGEASKGEIITNYIKALNYDKIDYLIGTHPHTDHIGGLAHIINNFSIEKIYMPKVSSNSKTYENLLNIILQKGLKITTANSQTNILNNENLSINFIAPTKEYSSLNNNSAVLKITYKERKFLFMGDAETQSENDIVADVSADVIKIGHHGSDTSSGQSFVNKVNPQYAIVMVGNNNKYDHPKQTIIERWSAAGAKIYRTDLNGNITVTSNGYTLSINTDK